MYHPPPTVFQEIVFSGTNDTGDVLREKGKHRVWRWLDYRQRFGFTEHPTVAAGGPGPGAAMLAVAALAPDRDVATLAEMTTFLLMYDQLLQGEPGMTWLLGGGGGEVGDSGAGVMAVLAMEEGVGIPDVLLEVAQLVKVIVLLQ